MALDALRFADGQVAQYNDLLRSAEGADGRYRLLFAKLQKDTREGGDWTRVVTEPERHAATRALVQVRAAALEAVRQRAALRAQPALAAVYEDGDPWALQTDLAGYIQAMGDAWAWDGEHRIDPNMHFLKRRAAWLYAFAAMDGSAPTFTQNSLHEAQLLVGIGERLKPQAIVYLDGLAKNWDELSARAKQLQEQLSDQLGTFGRHNNERSDCESQLETMLNNNVALMRRLPGQEIPPWPGSFELSQRIDVLATACAADCTAMEPTSAEFGAVVNHMAQIALVERRYPALEASRGWTDSDRVLPDATSVLLAREIMDHHVRPVP